MASSNSPRKATPLRVAVVGAGVIGLTIALELRTRGADVAVYDRGLELGAGVTIRAAGMLGAAFEWAAEDDQRALAALARHSGMLWPDFASRIERVGGGADRVLQRGRACRGAQRIRSGVAGDPRRRLPGAWPACAAA